MGWIDLIEYGLYALGAVALWRTFPRRRGNSSPVYVEVCKPDNDSSRLLTERRN